MDGSRPNFLLLCIFGPAVVLDLKSVCYSSLGKCQSKLQCQRVLFKVTLYIIYTGNLKMVAYHASDVHYTIKID